MKASVVLPFLLGAVAGERGFAQFLVYDNTKHPRTNAVYRFSREYGDEVFLGNGNRALSQLTFQYFGDFNPVTNKTAAARLRIYLNDGKDGIPGPKTALMPKTLLFESPAIPLASGFNQATVELPSVQVPESFTWTVQFTGMSFAVNDSAGLVPCDPPTIGAALPDGKRGSFWDAWIRDDPNRVDAWSLLNFGFKPADPKASFYCRIYATPDDGTWALPETLQRGRDGKVRFRVRGKQGKTFQVQVSENLTEWRPWKSFEGGVNPTEVVDDEPGAENRFYRVDE